MNEKCQEKKACCQLELAGGETGIPKQSDTRNLVSKNLWANKIKIIKIKSTPLLFKWRERNE
jgi:hypothetical protein